MESRSRRYVSQMPKTRLSSELMTAFNEYMKWRHGHNTPDKYWEIHHSILNSLRNGDDALREKFLNGVNEFLKTNKEIITEAKRKTYLAEVKRVEEILISKLN